MGKRQKKRKQTEVEVVEPPEATPHEEASLGEDRGEGLVEELDAVKEGEDSHALVESAEAAVGRLTSELEDQKDRYLRLAAEFDNFRKRVARDRSEIRARAQADVVSKMLDSLDDLARVTALDPADASAADVVSGIEMVERKLLRELQLAGLTKLGFVGEPFDPNYHEAVSTTPAPEDEKEDHVAAVFQVGYRFGGALLRAARVQVFVTRAMDEVAED